MVICFFCKLICQDFSYNLREIFFRMRVYLFFKKHRVILVFLLSNFFMKITTKTLQKEHLSKFKAIITDLDRKPHLVVILV